MTVTAEIILVFCGVLTVASLTTTIILRYLRGAISSGGGSPADRALRLLSPDLESGELGRRAVVALERIALAMEDQAARGGRSAGLRSFYIGDNPEEGGTILQDDEAFAELEKLEEERRKAGGEPSLDEELEPEDFGAPKVG